MLTARAASISSLTAKVSNHWQCQSPPSAQLQIWIIHGVDFKQYLKSPAYRRSVRFLPWTLCAACFYGAVSSAQSDSLNIIRRETEEKSVAVPGLIVCLKKIKSKCRLPQNPGLILIQHFHWFYFSVWEKFRFSWSRSKSCMAGVHSGAELLIGSDGYWIHC